MSERRNNIEEVADIESVYTVFGYIREHYVIKEKLDYPVILIQLILQFYFLAIRDNWDETRKGEQLSIEDDSIKYYNTSNPGQDQYVSLTAKINEGIYSWKFKIMKCHETSMFGIGVSRINAHNEKSLNDDPFWSIDFDTIKYFTGQESSKYQTINKDDIINMIINCNKNILSYNINGEKLGSHKN